MQWVFYIIDSDSYIVPFVHMETIYQAAKPVLGVQ